MTTSSDTIDITDLVSSLQSTWNKWATTMVFTALTTNIYLAWMKAPIISSLVQSAIGWVVNVISTALEMQGFFMNTAIRKASQAQDYISAKTAVSALPINATEEDFENAEKLEMATFRSLVMVTT